MREEQLNPSLRTQRQEATNADAGLTMWEILALPAKARRIINWMIRQQQCTLPEVAEYLGEDEPTAKSELDALVDQGLVQEIAGAGDSRYCVKLGAKRGTQLPETIIQQALDSDKPISTIINPSGEATVPVGSTFELGVSVYNNGNQNALIDIYIDETSGILRDWCVSSHERLALGPGQNSELAFQIKVPLEALPGTYDYTLVIDASQHYPEDTPLLHQATLQLISPDLNSGQ